MAWLAVVATLCAGLFAGAAVYINLVEHPARVEGGTTLAHTEFIPSYRRATLMQAPLALIGGVAGTAAWLAGGSVGWLVGAVLLAGVVPFTLLVILPTNNTLLGTVPGQASDEVSGLLRKWVRLHTVRTVLSCAAFLLFVALLARLP